MARALNVRLYLSAGRVHAPGARQSHKKTHPSLVPWSQLAEDEKDRDTIQSLPVFLVRAGVQDRTPAVEPVYPRQYAEKVLQDEVVLAWSSSWCTARIRHLPGAYIILTPYFVSVDVLR